MMPEQTEQTEQTAVQLVQAAEQLGITPEALRMRVKRGKAEGFKRNGRWHVYVNTAPKQLNKPTEQLNKPTEQRADADQTDATDFDRVAEAFALDMRRQIRRLEVQNDAHQAEMRETRQQHADQVRQMQENREGVPTPRGGRWHVQSTYRMLKRLEVLDQQDVA